MPAITFSSSWMMMNAVGMVSSRSRVVASTKRPMPSSRSRSIYLSTPPMIGSRLAITAMVSAIRCPGMSIGITCRVTKLGSRIRNRYGVGPPSLMAYTLYRPRGALDGPVGAPRPRPDDARAPGPAPGRAASCP